MYWAFRDSRQKPFDQINLVKKNYDFLVGSHGTVRKPVSGSFLTVFSGSCQGTRK